jgi:hypothetical protein
MPNGAGNGHGWGWWLEPLRWPVRAVIVLLGHVLLALVLITVIWALEGYAHWLNGGELPLLWGKVPLKWAFDTMDAGVLVLFIARGLIEAARELFQQERQ